ncbi:bacteriophage CI repressor [Novosphingobium sp. EMRT-2]|uniref:bacteriophage CI repressor n=1 Tax=Novosphingobium sp. EMRT-2 TaxID=2571749 RepID=UPI0010BD95A0|nr:bacteriophage CI repressor [Novosphingobium sp. EMRT-2]QCI93442.1 bacteriophage CI repressor [Novosphingobium sp. EMRT-2]
MSDDVDKLRVAVGAQTDLDLAAKLGLDRSTIAQWRRRGQVPVRYRDLVRLPDRVAIDRYVRSADRRGIYGDGVGRFLLSAALANIPPDAMNFDESLSPPDLGWAREARVLSVVREIVRVCEALFGRPRCENEAEYLQLMSALESPDVRTGINLALIRGYGPVGEGHRESDGPE